MHLSLSFAQSSVNYTQFTTVHRIDAFIVTLTLSPFYDLNLSSKIKKRDKFEINNINRTFLSQTTL